MKLNEDNFNAIVKKQENKVTKEEMKLLKNKRRNKWFRIFFSVVSVIMVIAILFILIAEIEVSLFPVLIFLCLCLLITISNYRGINKELCACYGIVREKYIRCAKGREVGYLPSEQTVETAAPPEHTSNEPVTKFHYCTVEIDGEIYENVRCDTKDFPKINIGDKVLISFSDWGFPVVYSTGK